MTYSPQPVKQYALDAHVKIEDELGGWEWRLNGRRHHMYEPAVHDGCDVYAWYCHDELHRADGPAWISNYKHMWFWHGQLHNLKGPAFEYINNRFSEPKFAIYGQDMSFKQWANSPLVDTTSEEFILLKLKYG